MSSPVVTCSSVYDQPDLKVKQIKTPGIAQFSYIIESDNEIAIIDPTRDIQIYLDQAKDTHSKVKWVIETHYHADFVSGYHDLAKHTHAKVVFGPESNPAFDCRVLKQNEKIAVGCYHLEALHTPGHTFESTCFVLESQAGHQLCVFTGDTLFIGDVGRPDLVQAATKSPQDMARMLFKSLKSLKSLPPQCTVLPAHGAGSACGKAISGGDKSTIADQLKENAAFKEEDETAFINLVTEGLTPPPAYWSMDVSMNKAASIRTFDDIITHSMVALSAKKVNELAADPHVFIVDTRKPEEFAHSHIPASLSIQYEQAMEVWTGFVVDPR